MLQSLEPSSEPPDDRQGAEGDRERDGREKGRKHKRAGTLPRRHTRNEPSAIRQRYRNSGSGRRSQPPAGTTTLAGNRERATRSGQWLFVGAEQCQIRSKALRQPVDGLLLDLCRRIRRGNKLGDEFAGNLERLAEWWNARHEMPKQSRREHDEEQACHDREIYLKIKPSHPTACLRHSLQSASDSSFLGFGEHVACPTDRDDAPRLLRIILDRSTDAGGVHVDRPVERLDLL